MCNKHFQKVVESVFTSAEIKDINIPKVKKVSHKEEIFDKPDGGKIRAFLDIRVFTKMRNGRVVTTEVPVWVCSVCASLHNNEHIITTHKCKKFMKTRNVDKECKKCKCCFNYLPSYRQHIQYCDGLGEKKSKKGKKKNKGSCKCPYGQVFQNKAELEKHQLKHPFAVKERCEKCDKIFQTRPERKSHSATCKNDIVCNVCGAKYDGLKKFKAHKLDIHAGTATFKCGCCKQKFLVKESFLDHMTKNIPSSLKCIKTNIFNEYVLMSR